MLLWSAWLQNRFKQKRECTNGWFKSMIVQKNSGKHWLIWADGEEWQGRKFEYNTVRMTTSESMPKYCNSSNINEQDDCRCQLNHPDPVVPFCLSKHPKCELKLPVTIKMFNGRTQVIETNSGRIRLRHQNGCSWRAHSAQQSALYSCY